ncbi:MAG: PEP/pyruvate-binding domain-containing protein, partial [Halobacteriota archaeon]
PDDLEQAYDRLGRGRVAVRSSASDEDGTAVSFAGQHATVLDVEGVPALRDAITHCIHSLYSERAQAYRRERAGGANGTMSVIVQRMVDARSAGALFTADPTTARRDRMIVDAIEGAGDALVSGVVTPDHFTLARDGSTVTSELRGAASCLQPEELHALAADAKRIEEHFGTPVDCEWAIDHAGNIAWLQARPITTLPADPRELDSELNPDDVYTRCNMDEMFPGVATPLTWSTVLRALDNSEQRLYSKMATYNASERTSLLVQQFGYPFMNLSRLAGIARSMIAGSEEQTAETLCGKPVAEIVPGPRAPQSERIRNGVRYAIFMFSRHSARLKQLIPSIDLTPGASARATYAVIDREVPKLTEAWFRHQGASVLSAALAPALLMMIAKGAEATSQHNAEVARLLSGAEDVESYDIAAGITRIVSALVEHDEPQLDHFIGLDAHAADHFLRIEASAPARREYGAYLERHGHRCMREVELREKRWSENPTPIVEAVQSGIRATRAGHVPPPEDKHESAPLKFKLLVRAAQRGIRDREMTRSQAVMVFSLFRRAYRTLARQMANEGILPDEDLVFFLQHAELGELIHDRDSKLIDKARARRAVLRFQEKFYFKQNSLGSTLEPIDPPRPSGESVLHGKPVSLGIVRGRARVALTLAEASNVQPGEILIAQFTDVGWTPCFATIAGFASDIGSAISHGAVVAREYRIPAVVNLHNATATFRTGDLVELDANQGVLRRIPEE